MAHQEIFMSPIIPVILAGGSGTRLWPLSRDMFPKQLIPLTSELTMLQNTVHRLSGLDNLSSPIIICNEKNRFMTAEQLRAIDVAAETIILEPVGRNTAPAVAVAALKGLSVDPESVLMVLPADHHIADGARFHEALRTGVALAAKDFLVTFGIVPAAPETGYGYIKKGAPLGNRTGSGAGGAMAAHAIDQFVEKPDIKVAEGYVASGNYCWNSGMFMFKASAVLEELNRHAPEMVAACKKAMKAGREDLDFFRLDPEAFAECPSDSIDYAVMEKTDRGAMIPMDAGWNDLGSWEALWQVGGKDAHDNVIKGDVLVHDVKNSYLHSTGRLISAVGLENHIVVETPDAVLISPRNRVQDVKRLVNRLKADERTESETHRKMYRPWGASESVQSSERFEVKRLTVKPEARISLQKHFNRAEHWIVVKGTAMVVKDKETFLLKEDESIYIPAGVVHRLENPGKIDLELIEIRTGSYLGENDIERFDDDYGRHNGDIQDP
jgi:mannose-1-phosphate guanylyltransferase/mannose-1-phosphate guanylyltransferase/mannose-6-phosphate isomerase